MPSPLTIRCNRTHQVNLFPRLIAISCLVVVSATALADDPTPDPTTPDATVNESKPSLQYIRLEPLPHDVTLATLSNGLTVIVQENRVAPVATVRCFVKNTGSAFEGEYLGMGISHLLEHLVAGGTTENRTEKEIEKLVDSFGGASNAYTSSSLTNYFIDCPARDVMTCIDLISEQMQRAAFTQEEFDREYQVVQRELADGEADRSRVRWNMLSRTMYLESPVRNPVIGYLDVLRKATRETAAAFYRARYVPNNQVFVVVGDVDTQAVLDRIAEQWSSSTRSEETYIPLVEEPPQMTPREAIREMEGTTFDVALCWPTVALSHPDLYALDVASYVLTEGDSSRLVRRIKYEDQNVLSISSASYTPAFVNGWFGVFFIAKPETWEAAERDVLAEVYRLRTELVDAAELNKAKKQKAAEIIFGQQTVQQAAESLGRSYLSTGDPLYDQKYAENIQKVTAEQVLDVAQRYFDPQRLSRILIVPPGGTPKADKAEKEIAQADVQEFKLANGLRVLVKRHASLPLVNIQAAILGGNLVDTPETAGRSALVSAMLDKGIDGASAQQIAGYFDAIGGSFAQIAGRNSLIASATTLSEDFPEAAELFAKCVTASTFPDDEFQKVKNLALGAILQRKNNPQEEAFELFFQTLPATSPYHVLKGGTTESISNLTVDDLKRYHRQYFVPNNMIVTVFGDIDPKEALAIVERGFGHLEPAPEFQPPSFDRENALAETVVRHQKIGKPTAMVVMGYPAVSILNENEQAAFTVLDAILSGYGAYPGGWLHNELRGEGLVYFVHAFSLTGPAPGYFTILAQTRPDKLDEVVKRIQSKIDKIKAGDVTTEEFETAIKMILALHAQENTTIGEQARLAALDDLFGLGYNYDESFDARIQAVTLEDVVAVAKKYLNEHVLVTTSPEDAPLSQDNAKSSE